MSFKTFFPATLLLFLLLLTQHIGHSVSSSEVCDKSKCEPLLDCHAPNRKIDYNDTKGCCVIRVCTCRGTENHNSENARQLGVYERHVKMYENCTLVDGNLEIVAYNDVDKFPNINYTKNIKEVIGYVLISKNSVQTIDLSSLRLIRGENQFDAEVADDCAKTMRSNITSSLYIGHNTGLEEIWMPNLAEIKQGNVTITGNRRLCHLDTIEWRQDIFNDPLLQHLNSDLNTTLCGSCPSECHSDELGRAACWSNQTETVMCQKLTKVVCGDCVSRCNPRTKKCCSSQCAAGCYGAGADTYTCNACKGLNLNGECRGSCEMSQIVEGGTIKRIEGNYQFQYARYCVKECPKNTASHDSVCTDFCTDGYYPYDGKKCVRIDPDSQCTDPNGCDRVCQGLFTKYGPLKDSKHIDGDNIGLFDPSCTIIDGSLVFLSLSFTRDNHCKRDGITAKQLEVFRNVREITGSLSIEGWLSDSQNLCIFRNLEKIGGKHLTDDTWALEIVVDDSNLRNLCLDNLKTIVAGDVYVDCNPYIDHVKKVKWKRGLMRDPANQRILLQHCTSRVPCHPACTQGCWGRLPTQCVKCKDYTDITDEKGQLTKKPILINSHLIPGVTTTTCVKKCDLDKGVFATSNKTCEPCHESCFRTCNGSTSSDCTGTRMCKTFRIEDSSRCVEVCPHTHYPETSTDPGKDSLCRACSRNCVEVAVTTARAALCKGPKDDKSEKGCSFCHVSYDPNTLVSTYTGQLCPKCQTKNCNFGCTSQTNSTTEVECYNPGSTKIIIIVVVMVLAFIAISVFIWWYHSRKSKKTVAKIQSVINYNNDDQDEVDIEMPILATAHKANLAQLRIVTESELQFGKLLGSGAFGEVYKAIWTPFSVQGEKIQIAVAVKTLKTCDEMLHDANNQVMEEAYIMASVDCVYLTRLLGICLRDQVSLITQLMPLGSLLEYIRDPNYKSTIRSRQMLTWCLQIAKGMKYLEEEKHLVHRDLAARNVLVKTPNHVKITDFGLAKMLDVKEDIYYAEGGKLPIKWLALECITERTFSHLSDVWAYGVTCWEIFTFGSRPYEGVKAIDMLSLLERGDRLPQPACASIDVYMLLIKCWMVERLCRPTFGELIDEFSKMVAEPQRYLVLKTDDCATSQQAPVSPTMDETEFFRELLQDERIDEEAVIADEPDEYLLCTNVTQQPQYTNQTSIEQARQEEKDKQQGNHHQQQQQQARSNRLFSRNTPSANNPSSSTSTLNTRLTSTSLQPSSLNHHHGSEATTPTTNHMDDVFAVDHQHRAQQQQNPAGGSSGQPKRVFSNSESCRKDSEDSNRYTEDPTHYKRFDEDYLAPSPASTSGLTSGARNADNEGDYIEGEPFRYDTQDYLVPDSLRINSSEPQRSSVSSTSSTKQHRLIGNHTKLEDLPENDYATTLQCAGGDDKLLRHTNNQQQQQHPTCFSNEEYMTTDSGIGDPDTQSLLSRHHTGASSSARNNSNRSSNEDEDDDDAPLLVVNDDDDDDKQQQLWLENPEYMLLPQQQQQQKENCGEQEA